jgi:AmmeMemoRadiSam system protein B
MAAMIHNFCAWKKYILPPFTRSETENNSYFRSILLYPVIMKTFPAFFIVLVLACFSCQRVKDHAGLQHIRPLVDTVGFAQYAWQVDSVLARISRYQTDALHQVRDTAGIDSTTCWKLAISPHDDYAYVGYLYPAVLQPVKASTVILFGVAHKARQLNLENRLVFGSYDAWKAPFGPVRISALQNKILAKMDTTLYVVNDSMVKIEHSLEALVPFLQKFNPTVEIIPILVPYMSFSRMQEISVPLAAAIHEGMAGEGKEWGKDFMLLVSTDAVHYGDQDWGGLNYARYGTDTTGYLEANAFEHEIIRNTLIGPILPERVEQFTRYTVEESDYHMYKWTWCGRYSVPMGLLTAYELQDAFHLALSGRFIGYSTSIADPVLPVTDLGMGLTAGASLHHWVGYAAIGYE